MRQSSKIVKVLVLICAFLTFNNIRTHSKFLLEMTDSHHYETVTVSTKNNDDDWVYDIRPTNDDDDPILIRNHTEPFIDAVFTYVNGR